MEASAKCEQVYAAAGMCSRPKFSPLAKIVDCDKATTRKNHNPPCKEGYDFFCANSLMITGKKRYNIENFLDTANS